MTKKISVVIPTYNRREQTISAIESVACSFPELVEVIVVDDAGIEEFSYLNINQSGISVNIIRLSKNSGAGVARSVGVNCAKGEYIAFLDSDDIFAKDWIDTVFDFIEKDKKIIITGGVVGANYIHHLIYKMLNNIPQFMKLPLTRVITLFFNPFYTPSLVLSKSICRFHDTLRYCEDYYTFSSAIFMADDICISKNMSCYIGRKPNTLGGLSSAHSNMFNGEMFVRKCLFNSEHVQFLYKVLVPFGILYQYSRNFLKKIIGR